MANDNELLIKINANAKGFQAELGRVQAQTKQLETSLASVAKVSAAAFAGLTTAIVGTAAAFATFESKFTNVVTLLDNSSFKTKSLTEGIDGLKKGVISLAAESGETFDNLNKGLFDLISAGVPAGDAINSLRIATNLAKAGATDTAVAVDGLTSALNAYSLSADQTQSVSEKFFTAQKAGKTTIEELSSGFGLVGSSAAALGVNLDELLAAVSATTLGGLKTNAAYTGLKAVLANIAKPTADAVAEARRLGVAFDLSALKSKGLVKFLGDLRKANGFTQDSVTKLFGSVEAQGVAFSLTGAQAEAFTKITGDLGDAQASAATFAEALAVKNETTEEAFKRLKGSVTAVAVVLGEQFAPTINALSKSFTEIAKGISEMDTTTLKTIASIISFGAALAGAVASISIGTLAFLKLRAGLVAFRALIPTSTALVTGLGAAFQSTWAKATLGLTLLIPLYTHVISKTKELLNGFGEIAKDNEARKTILKAEVQQLGTAIQKREELLRQIRKNQSAIIELGGSASAVDRAQVPALQAKIEQQRESLGLVEREIRGLELQRQAYRDNIKAQKEAASVQKTEVSISSDGGDPLSEAQIASQEKRKQFEIMFQSELSEIRKTFNEAEIQALAEKIELENEIKDEALQTDLEKRIEFENQQNEMLLEIEEAERERKRQAQLQDQREFLENKMKFGETVANLDKFLNNQHVKGVQKTSQILSGLMKSRNKEMFEIGKAAALVNIAISTAQGAMDAYKSLAGIPYVGPVLGGLAAAAVIAMGATQLGEVSSQSFQAAGGGFVPNVPDPGRAGLRDSVPTFLEPGELIVPKNIAPNFVQAIGNPDNSEEILGDAGSGNVYNMNIGTLVSEDDDAVATLFEKFKELVEFNNVQPLTAV